MNKALKTTGLDLASTLRRALASPKLDAHLRQISDRRRRQEERERLEFIDQTTTTITRRGPLAYELRISTEIEGEAP